MSSDLNKKSQHLPGWRLVSQGSSSPGLTLACETLTRLAKRVLDESATQEDVQWLFGLQVNRNDIGINELKAIREKVLAGNWTNDPDRLPPVALGPLDTSSVWGGDLIDARNSESLALPLIVVFADALDSVSQFLTDDDRLSIEIPVAQGDS